MFGNAAFERAALETTYEDLAAVYRTVPQTNADNITRPVREMLYANIPCALSYTGSDQSKQTAAQNIVDYDAVIFLGPEPKILPGDQIVLKRFGRERLPLKQICTFEVVGRPAIYATHQEVKGKDSDLA